MKLIIKNETEAKDYIDQVRGRLIAELIFNKLMQQPEYIRGNVYEMLISKNNTEIGEHRQQ